MEIKTIEELKSLKKGQRFNYHCVKCGIDVVVNRFDTRRLYRYTSFMCKRCKITESSHKHRYFGDAGLTKDNPVITNNDPNLLDKIAANNWFKFTCTNCGKEIVAYFKSDRIEAYKKFLCGKCKFDDTMMSRYGVTRALKSEKFLQKMKDTNTERYGKPNYMTFGSKEHENVMIEKHCDPKYCNRDKIVETTIERYGGKSSFCSEEVRDKVKKTFIDKYGVENVFLLDEFQEKRRITMNERYGVDYTAESPELRKKMRETCIKLYGKETGFAKGAYSIRYKYCDINFDSLPEMCVYLYCLYTNIPIIRNCDFGFPYKDIKGKDRHVYPDFIINNQYVEIKGAHFFKPDGTMWLPYREPEWDDERYEYESSIYESKRQCLLANGVIIIKDTDPWVQMCVSSIINLYSKQYLQMFNLHYWNNLCYGYTPFNCDQTKEYQKPIGLGLTPFDI